MGAHSLVSLPVEEQNVQEHVEAYEQTVGSAVHRRPSFSIINILGSKRSVDYDLSPELAIEPEGYGEHD